MNFKLIEDVPDAPCEYTFEGLMELPVIRARDMPPGVRLTDLLFVETGILVQKGAWVVPVTEVVPIWAGAFGWYRVVGMCLPASLPPSRAPAAETLH